MISLGVVRVVNPKSDIFNTNLPSIRQLHDLSLPCTDTSLLCKYVIPWKSIQLELPLLARTLEYAKVTRKQVEFTNNSDEIYAFLLIVFKT